PLLPGAHHNTYSANPNTVSWSMSQRKETLVSLVSLLLTGVALVGGLRWYQSTQSRLESRPPVESQQPLSSRISQGERVLLTTSPEKEAAARGVSEGDEEEAIAQFEAALEQSRNDPEALIYLNNARIGSSKSYGIVASVPIGSDANAAREILRGVAQAQNEINEAGGIGGIRLKVFVGDDNNDPEIARQLARAYSQNREILGVVGHFGSETSLAAAQVYQKEGVAMISPTSTSVELSGKGEYIFRTVPSDRFAGSALADYLLETLQKKQGAVFYNAESTYSQSLKTVFTTELYAQGGEIVAEFDFANGEFNAAEAVQSAIDSGAEAILLAPNSAVLDKALQVVQVNDNRLPLLAGDSAYKPETLQVGRRDAVGMVLAVPWHSLGDPDSTFPETARQLWGGEVNWRTAIAYDAAQALIAAMAVNPTRQGIQEVLSSTDFSATGASDEIRFLPSGDRNQAVQLVTIEPGERTNFDYEFVPISPRN
ncbi:MAG: ABC transporter substrate-binding protein, partial [Cyanobacteriota bacterium]|nr:ABC transporter substrate-binding protein [Cyanobacteriota bacterium]